MKHTIELSLVKDLLVNNGIDLENTKIVKFVFDKLPEDVNEVQGFISEECADTGVNTLIGLQRLREFYNPLLAENFAYVESFSKFMISLLNVWADLSRTKGKGEKISIEKAIRVHLKELCSPLESSKVIVSFFSAQM